MILEKFWPAICRPFFFFSSSGTVLVSLVQITCQNFRSELEKMSAAQRYWLVLSVMAGPACTSLKTQQLETLRIEVFSAKQSDPNKNTSSSHEREKDGLTNLLQYEVHAAVQVSSCVRVSRFSLRRTSDTPPPTVPSTASYGRCCNRQLCLVCSPSEYAKG